MSPPAPRRRPAAGLVALLALFAGDCGDDDDPTADAEAIRARCLADAPPALQTALTGGRWRTDPCSGDGPCDRRLTLESTCVTYETRAADGEILQLSHGTLTAEGRARGAAIAGELLGVDLPGIAGACPDADAAREACEVRWIALVRAGEGSSHELRGAAPAALAAAAAHLEALRSAIARCEGGPLLTIAGRCEEE